ncbi:hypothetical protein FDECE_8824 [Fusarium decemcellulare]|nr:hypothetical protein FDECE_8824 [Fusarium decemcellulare]
MSSPKSRHSQSPAGGRSPGSAEGQGTDAQLGGIIEVDENDSDSSYSVSTRVTDTESLRSSILNYKWENGRRYHSYQDGSYWHEMYRIILDGELYVAPIGDHPQEVLDLGTGTGLWAIELADMHPSANVLGVDLSPIQPSFVPPNCKFEVDDINQEWTYPEEKFDFIHMRGLTGCIPDWDQFHEKAIKYLKPGGWVEHVELWGWAKSDDGTLRPDSPLRKWVDIFIEIGKITGKTFFWGDKAGESIRKAGYINVSERTVKVPIGTWPKDKRLKSWGAWNRQFLLQGVEGFCIRGLTEMLGWKYEDIQLYLTEMRNEFNNPAVHSYFDVTIIYGQKPEAKTEDA